LEYHLGNCEGPCEGLQSASDYLENIEHVRHVLKGNTQSIIRKLKEDMQASADALAFEKAAVLKKKIAALKNYTHKSTVVSTHIGNLDVASISTTEDQAFVNYMMLNNGSVIHTQNITIQKRMDESYKDILSHVVSKLRDVAQSTAKEIVTPLMIDVTDLSVTCTIPKAGDKKKLLDLSRKNVLIYKHESLRQIKSTTKTLEKRTEILEELQ